MHGVIKMELLSDTCIGSGESVAGIVDSEIVYNDEGLPYIPSKRIIGILRREAEELNLVCDNKYDCMIKEIFGDSGNATSGKLILRNGMLEESIIKTASSLLCVEKPKFKRIDILECFTDTRTQTAINDKGVSEDKSLRISRVIKKGNIFYFPIEISSEIELDKSKIKFIKDLISCLRHIGENRNRGFGHVKCSFEKDKILENNKNNNNKLPKTISDGKLIYNVELLSDCILNDDFISGSSILGIATSKYIKDNNLTKEKAFEDSTFNKLFLDGKVVIANAHNQKSGSGVFIPTPACYKFEKGKDQKVYNLLAGYDKNKTYSSVDEQYCKLNIYDKKVAFIKTKKTKNNHHKSDSDFSRGSSGLDGTIYQYNAVKSGTSFSGYIYGSQDNLILLYNLLNNTNAMLGKSKKSQYGACKITIKDNADDEHEKEEIDIDNIKDFGFVPILLNSDLIVLNNFGQPSLSLDILLEQIKYAYGLEDICIEKEKCFVKTSLFNRYNATRNLPDNTFACFGKGSVISLNIKDLDEKILEQFIKNIDLKFVGEYTRSGYGKLSILPLYNKINFVNSFDKEEKRSDIKDADKNNDFIYKLKINKAIKELKKKIFKDDDFNRGYYQDLLKYLSKANNKATLRFLIKYSVKNIDELSSELKNQVEKEVKKIDKEDEENRPYTTLKKILKLNDRDKLFDTTRDLYSFKETTDSKQLERMYLDFLKYVCQKVSNKTRKGGVN